MNCLQAEEHFSAYFENTLNYQTLQDFETHCAECEACQHEYAKFQESVKAVQQLPQIEPSPDFVLKVIQRLAEEQHKFDGIKETIITRWHRLKDGLRAPRWAFSGVVALILIAAIGGYLYQEDLFFDRDAQPVVVGTPAPGSPRVVTPSVDVRDQGRNTDPFLSSGVTSTLPGRRNTQAKTPMQQHYVLKQVSYTSASTRGGL